MWMVDPKLMCNQHLLGEHVELHMFVGTIKKRKSLDGFVKNNLLEFLSIEKRHTALALEMTKRKMNHKSVLPRMEQEDFDFYSHKVVLSEVNKEESFKELMRRCDKCKQQIGGIK
jgi:hypothetical protein